MMIRFAIVFVCMLFTGCGFQIDDVTDAKMRGAEKGQHDRIYFPRCLHGTPEWSPLRKETAKTLEAYKASYVSVCGKPK